MGLKKEEIAKIREEIEYTKKPLIFFDDDPDGLCSFLLLFRQLGCGKGVIVKAHPNIDHKFLRKVHEFNPDKIFVLDIAMMEQDFVDEVKKPIVWIDHHTVQQRQNVMYFNPRKHDPKNNIPTSSLCYDIVKNKKNLWLGMVGSVGDWFLPHFLDEFRAEYPDLLPDNITQPEEALFNSQLGKLVKIFSFVIKGSTNDALKYIKVLTRIESPYEILDQSTPRGKFIYKRYEVINKDYETLLDDIIKKREKNNMLIYTYSEDRMSFTGDVTNELLYLYPKQVVLVGREKSGEYKCSLRSPKGITISDKLKRALVGIKGYGGGHEHACGVVIKKEDFDKFNSNLKNEIKKG